MSARNLTPAERDTIFGPVEVQGDVVGRDTVVFKTPPGPPPLVEVQFGPHTVKVHEIAAPSLQAIAAELEADGVMPLVTEIAGFQPRLVRTTEGGNKPVLSAHAYGAAVDVNFSDNPQGGEATPEQRELARYFEGHGWFWGGHFSEPDPHHFAFQGVDPTDTTEGLKCPVNRELWAAEHSIALVPGRMQRWILGVTARRDADEDTLTDVVREVFRYWVPLFNGTVSVPEVRLATDEERELAAESRTFEMRSPLHFVVAEFGYRGPDDSMPVPTFVRRRRARIEFTCPVPPIDVAPVVALEAEEEADFDDLEAVQGRPPVATEDPLDLGLGPIDPDDIKAALDTGIGALTTALWVAGGVGALLLLYKLTSNGRRASWN